ncbi:ELMO domain-containing protein A [Camellia lanceoleosa]|uniref:ELMO domain-containing protein A n=1 Tax=Camellia lanceoleosa TaxID=1840588 RepID=A0ACC0FUX0_9ERIC|nr:ELMO domain-containing protein A [Camellia lanceoleosa]
MLRANLVVGSGTLIGRLLPFPSATQNGQTKKLLVPSLSPLQEVRLKSLQQRLQVPFDGSLLEHQDALKQLWRLAYPDRELPSLKSDFGRKWVGKDPILDRFQEAFQSLLHKRDGRRAEWEYPFAVAGINMSFTLVQMLDIQSGKPTTVAGIRFLDLLIEDEMAFDNLYCIAFQMMDAQWLAMRASYMEFNDVLKSTRTQLERELELEDVSHVKDLPAYNLLKR